MKKYFFAITAIVAFMLLAPAARAVMLNTGICTCTFTVTSSALPATSDNCASTIASRISADSCLWQTDTNKCFCQESLSSLSQSECKASAQTTLENAFRLTPLPGAAANGSCDWISTAVEETPAGETPSTGAGTPPRLEFEPPLGTTDVNELIGYIIRAVTGIIGSIALLMFVAGGFVWMTAAGNEERVKLGKNILIWSTLGLVVIFSAYAITRYILTALLE